LKHTSATAESCSCGEIALQFPEEFVGIGLLQRGFDVHTR
jgi:hypothetical protein